MVIKWEFDAKYWQIASLPLLEVPRHEITVSPVVARKLELAYQREAMRIGRDD